VQYQQTQLGERALQLFDIERDGLHIPNLLAPLSPRQQLRCGRRSTTTVGSAPRSTEKLLTW
jgi:hypothetical protein